MNTPTKLTGFALVLVASFLGATALGNAVGPVNPSAAEDDHDMTQAGTGGDGSAAGELPGGLLVSQDGYTLDLDQNSLPAGETTPLAFQILGPDGAAVTDFEVTHDKELHLIAVRRDMTGFQHVHPELADDGTWHVPLALTAGPWQVFADFAPAGHGETLILGADLAVPGGYDPQPLPEPAAAAEVDGYTVTLDGELKPGEESELTLSVSWDGQPVTDLEPYLAAYGHLVVLRDGDLAYLHVHPGGMPGDGITEPGPAITFYANVPSAGDYRLFLDFQHEGVVRSAEFTARADGTVAPAGDSSTGNDDTADADGHGD
ncbi:MAG: hypothetical protein ACR2J5_13875 [Geodermatophilaceae bacterium]|jgi:hypothetical protein